METQLYTVDNSLKHQTGVTERSIRSDDRDPGHQIVHDVVIRDDPDGIGAGRTIQLCRYNLLTSIEVRFGNTLESRTA